MGEFGLVHFVHTTTPAGGRRAAIRIHPPVMVE
jgi:hypothetical protein